MILLQTEDENETILYDYNCSTLTHYTHGICFEPLQEILAFHNCTPNPDGSIQVVVNGEKRAKKIIHSLNIITAKPSCKKAVIPFLCLYLFGVCSDIDNILYITSKTCERIRDVECVKEWEIATALSKYSIDKLPSCVSFPPETMYCEDGPKRTRKKAGISLSLQ